MEFLKKNAYRIVCMIILAIAFVVIIEMVKGNNFDIKLILIIVCLGIAVFWGFYDWNERNKIIERKDNEIKLYKMYVMPLEELTREIRARQHEFDNHMNAILNMHVVIDNYEELVDKQSHYIKEMYQGDSRQLISLLKISDKILAGFLYSKIIAAPSYVNVNLQVRNFEIVSTVSEHDLIEIIGTLVDNAYEACADIKDDSSSKCDVDIVLDSDNNKVLFQIRNKVKNMDFNTIAMFFKKGYSTKGQGRGLGLTNAKNIAQKCGGDIMVEINNESDGDYVNFSIEL